MGVVYVSCLGLPRAEAFHLGVCVWPSMVGANVGKVVPDREGGTQSRPTRHDEGSISKLGAFT